MEEAFIVRSTGSGDEDWIRAMIKERWGAEIVVAHGRIFHPARLPAFTVEDRGGKTLGLATYEIRGLECELVTLDSLAEDRGVGTALLKAVIARARESACRRFWLITTNDNLRALRFYQKRGMRLSALHRNALDRSRELKPSIPLVGTDGIPLRDELELELDLSQG